MKTGKNLKHLYRQWISILLITTLVSTSIPAFAYAATDIDAEPDAGMETEMEESLEDHLILESDLSEENAVPTESTADSTVFELGDGKKTAIFYSQPVRFEDENGTLRDYEPTLVEITGGQSSLGKDLSGYAFENESGDKKQYLPEELSENTPIMIFWEE
ncbi:MAG: hypothetical protein U0M21_09480 [Emergencia sp.]|nr:hypothetical protein [Emergencia sp.]